MHCTVLALNFGHRKHLQGAYSPEISYLALPAIPYQKSNHYSQYDIHSVLVLHLFRTKNLVHTAPYLDYESDVANHCVVHMHGTNVLSGRFCTRHEVLWCEPVHSRRTILNKMTERTLLFQPVQMLVNLEVCN